MEDRGGCLVGVAARLARKRAFAGARARAVFGSGSLLELAAKYFTGWRTASQMCS